MMLKRVVRNRGCLASGTDGTASLTNRDFGRIMSASGPEMVFSGAAQHADKAAGADYFADSSRESADRGTRWRRGRGSNPRYRLPSTPDWQSVNLSFFTLMSLRRQSFLDVSFLRDFARPR